MIEEYVQVKWNAVNKSHFEALGYKYTKIGEQFTCKTVDLSNSSRAKVNLICDDCGHKQTASFFNYTKSLSYRESGMGCHRCRKCALLHRRGMTHNEFVDLVFKIGKGEYEVLNKYRDANTYINFKHSVCGFEFTKKATKFYNGNQRCPYCIGSVANKTTGIFKFEVKYLTGDEYEVLSEYVNSATPLKMKHNICGRIYDCVPSYFGSGNRCPHCNRNFRKTTEKFKQEMFALVGSEYDLIGEYRQAHIKTAVRHVKCGNVYEVAPSMFLDGRRCPKCLFSRGEKSVDEYLTNHNLLHDYQIRFADCKYRIALPFDFGVYEDKELTKLICLIEYDGEQHYNPTRRYGGKEQLKLVQKRDKIKTDYCAANNIPLIRIKYTEFKNIDTILTNELTKLGILTPTLVEA